MQNKKNLILPKDISTSAEPKKTITLELTLNKSCTQLLDKGISCKPLQDLKWTKYGLNNLQNLHDSLFLLDISHLTCAEHKKN